MYDNEFQKIDGELQSPTNRQMQTLFSLWIKTASLLPLQEIPTILIHYLLHQAYGIIAATGGMQGFLEKRNFTILFTKGKKTTSIHIIDWQRIILVVIFDQRSSLGLVRLRVKKAAEGLAKIFDEITSKSEKRKWKAARQQNRLWGDKWWGYW